MIAVRPKHEPYTTGHLADVTADMRTAGAPTIRVVEVGGVYYAIEGSHRLAAAEYLGLEPRLVVEIPEMDETCDEFWTRVSSTLPVVKFEHVHVLKLESFK